jgi:hypothetical protein
VIGGHHLKIVGTQAPLEVFLVLPGA